MPLASTSEWSPARGPTAPPAEFPWGFIRRPSWPHHQPCNCPPLPKVRLGQRSPQPSRPVVIFLETSPHPQPGASSYCPP